MPHALPRSFLDETAVDLASLQPAFLGQMFDRGTAIQPRIQQLPVVLRQGPRGRGGRHAAELGCRSSLRSFPVSYPSYYDQSGRLGAAVTDSTFTPVTVFYDRRGAQFIHQGPYLSRAKLEQDVRRYALDA